MYMNRNNTSERRSMILLCLCIGLLILSVLFLLAFVFEYRGYKKTAEYYDQLASDVSRELASRTTDTSNTNDTFTSRVDFSSLREKNPDVVGWISIPGMSLSLPVTWCGDNHTYLHKAFDGSESRNGCLFLAAQSAPDFSGCYQVIYGHNIHDGSMFGRLTEYADMDFWKQNPTFSLYTPNGDYLCKIFSCHYAEDQTEIYRADRDSDGEYAGFLERIKAASIYDTETEIPDNARVVTISTCDSPYGKSKNRFVVHAIMEQMPTV